MKSLKDKNAWALYPGFAELDTNQSHRITGIFTRTIAVPPQNTGRPESARHVRLVVEQIIDLFIVSTLMFLMIASDHKVGPQTD